MITKKIAVLFVIALVSLTSSVLACKSCKGCVDKTKPVKVYILAGQSNMVGMGDLAHAGSGAAIYRESADPKARKSVKVSLYKGKYDPSVDYDKVTPVSTENMNVLGGDKTAKSEKELTTIEGDYFWIARGFLTIKTQASDYTFHPGKRTNSVMYVDGKEVFNRDAEGNMKRTYIPIEPNKTYSFKAIFRDKNINPHWRYRIEHRPGTLETLIHQDGKFKHLIGKDGNWTSRGDVYYYDARIRFKGSQLSVTSNNKGKSIGPELDFGRILGDHHKEQVLLIKTAQGNRSLGWDFRPPSSGRTDASSKWESLEYKLMVEGVHKTLKDIANILPGYKGQGYEIAGFAWFQGHKDGYSETHIKEYEQNLINLITDFRNEFKVPNLPAVVATVGFYGYNMQPQYQKIHQAQMNVSDKNKHPEFAKLVKTVDTRPFWKLKENSPSDQDYHYNRNAETYLMIGDAIGNAMLELIKK